MKYSIITSLAVFITAAIAAPAAVPEAAPVEVAKRDIGHLYICTDINWGGLCSNVEKVLGECGGMMPPWQNSLSSAGPDQGITCQLYEDSWCGDGSRSITFGWPGYANLGDVGFNDRAGSHKCWRS